VEVGADRDAAALVGGVDDPVEALGGVGADGQQPDVVDLSGVEPWWSMFSQVATLRTRL
jgi:hypothetical protein